MPTPQTLITPTGFRIARPGVNVLSPPALTEDYLVIDQSWPGVERLHAYGVRRGASISGGSTSFGFSFPFLSTPPLAWVVPRIAGTTEHVDELMNSAGIIGGNILYSTYNSAYRWLTSQSAVTVLLSGMNPASYDWAFFVFRNG